jgi:hypothetical protein
MDVSGTELGGGMKEAEAEVTQAGASLCFGVHNFDPVPSENHIRTDDCSKPEGDE